MADLKRSAKIIMSRSHHAKSPRKRRQERALERDDAGNGPTGLLKLEELSLRKDGAKETERWRRDAAKAGGLRHHTFTFTDSGWDFRTQKMRGVLSDIPGEVVAPPKKKKPIQAPQTTTGSRAPGRV